MQKLFLTIGAVLILLLSSFAQKAEPVPAPADVVLGFEIEGGRHQFHFGELIPVSVSYTAKTAGRYFWVSQNWKLTGGALSGNRVLAFGRTCQHANVTQ